MKSLFYIIAVCLALGDLAQAQLPKITITHEGHRKELRVDEVSVNVRIVGDFVETRMTLQFFNETKINQEGEFLMPLPEGATVSHYELEVNGAMRAASIVEKERARFAYETIKRQNIDPGLVEREAGNIYRTRIFPILPNKSKSVSIGYVQRLKSKAGQLSYSLPFQLAKPVGKFTLKVSGDLAGWECSAPKGVKFSKQDDSSLVGESYKSSIHGSLTLQKLKAATLAIEQSDGDFKYSYIRQEIPQSVLDTASATPGRVTVVWDASATGFKRDLKKEIVLLEQWFTKLSNAKVRLLVLGYTLEDRGEFSADKSGWSKLKTVLEGIEYDGVANFDRVDYTKMNSDRVLFFSSGELVLPFNRQRCSAVLQIINSSGAEVSPVLSKMALESGGGIVDLKSSRTSQAVGQLEQLQASVISVAGNVTNSYVDAGENNEVIVHVKRPVDSDESLSVSFGYGGSVVKTVDVKMTQLETDTNGLLRRAWGQRELGDLETDRSVPDQAAIVKLCKKHALVSDYTSLIVLERFEDYVRFRIPPPEKDLLAKYKKAIEVADDPFTDNTNSFWAQFERSWQQRHEWYRKKYPWAEVALYPRYDRVKTWTNAQVSVFSKAQLAQTNHKVFQQWRNDVVKFVKGKKSVITNESYGKWMSEMKRLLDAGKALKNAPLRASEANEKFAVSVRGLVVEPKTIELSSGNTLKHALAASGGLTPYAQGDRVAVYRNGERVIHNTLSKQYKEVRLQAGDMIVVMAENYASSWSDDPFGDPFADEPSIDPVNLPAVEQEVVENLKTPTTDSKGLFGASNNGSPAVSLKSSFGLPDGKLDEGTIKQILDAEDVWGVYLSKRTSMTRDAFPKVAEKLYLKGEVKRARRVLSNLMHQGRPHVPSMLGACYWMIQFEDYKGAEEVLARARSGRTLEHRMIVEEWRLARYQGKKLKQEDYTTLGYSFNEPRSNRQSLSQSAVLPNELLLIEHNLRGLQAGVDLSYYGLDWIKKPNFAFRFPADIRVIVYSSSSGKGTILEITEPALVGSVLRSRPWGQGSISLTGGRVKQYAGVSEYVQRHAIPGTYKLQLSNRAETTYQVEVFLNWGKENQTRKIYTLSADGSGGMIDGGEVEFSL